MGNLRSRAATARSWVDGTGRATARRRTAPVRFLKESLKYRDEALWRLELRQMADPVEDLEAAAGNRLVCALAVADRDDRITRAPDDQHGEALGEVMPVAGVDALTAYPTTERSVARKAVRRSRSVSDA